MSLSCRLLFLNFILFHSAWGAIKDNSFLLEEAYNQAEDEYQFIQSYQTYSGGSLTYNLEIEIPVPDQRHQLSFDISRARQEETSESSFSDLGINYRWQAVDRNDFLLAQKFGLVIPTGSIKNQTSNGVLGFQLGQAVMAKVSDAVQNHWNLGVSIFPGTESTVGEEKTVTGFTGGSSFVYLYRDDLNFLIEAIFEAGETFQLDGNLDNETSFYLNPGLRYAFSPKWNEAQVVPGLAFPLKYIENQVQPGVYLYLSIESVLY